MKLSLQLLQQERKPCTFRKIPFSHSENEAFMWMQDYYMKGMPTDSKMT